MPAGLSTPVYLLSPDEVAPNIPTGAAGSYERLRAGFALQAHTAHVLAPDPESAAIVLAPIRMGGYGPFFEKLRRSPIYRRYAAKLVAYSPEEGQFPALRGLYPSVSRKWALRGWALPAHYISAHIHRFAFQRDEILAKDLLFSFVGSSRTHPLRERIVQWRHPSAVLIDASARNDAAYWWEKPNKDQLLATYRDVMRRSRFVICPRGVSASSIRLFEAMEAGAVPVIVADDLELPLGPEWERCSLRVREAEIDDVPQLVERCQEHATEMGLAARYAWETYFSPEATVGSVVTWANLLVGRGWQRPVGIRCGELTSPRLLKAKLRYLFGPGR